MPYTYKGLPSYYQESMRRINNYHPKPVTSEAKLIPEKEQELASSEYVLYLKQKEKELVEIGQKYEPETIQELAQRLYPYKLTTSLRKVKFAQRISLALVLVFVLLAFLNTSFLIPATFFVMLFSYYKVKETRLREQSFNNSVFVALMNANLPLKEKGWEEIINWDIQTPMAVMLENRVLFGSRFLNAHDGKYTRWTPRETRSRAYWQRTVAYEATELSALLNRDKHASKKVHDGTCDEELKKYMCELSSLWYLDLRLNAQIVELSYDVGELEHKVRKYKAIAKGAKDALDGSTFIEADSIKNSTSELLKQKRLLLGKYENRQKDLLEKYQKAMDELNEFAARVPAILAKEKAAKSLSSLHYSDKPAEKVLDFEESLADL